MDVEIVSYPTLDEYILSQQEYKAELRTQTLVATVLAVAQMVIYWDLFDDYIDARDDLIGKELGFLDDLHNYAVSQDLPMLRLKKSALSIPEPSANSCVEAMRYLTDSLGDGDAVDSAAQSFADNGCGDIPVGWYLYEGSLAAAKAQGIAGSYMASDAKRRQEAFRDNKIKIVQSAQQSMKSVFSASHVLGEYQQAVAIYSGLADLFISGFNSAGAGLGVQLDRLSQLYGNGSGKQITAGLNVNSGAGMTYGIGRTPTQV